MIEKTVLDYLIGQDLDGIGRNIFLEVPVNPPARYIVLEKTASGAANKIRSAMIAVQSICSDSLYTAAQVNEAVIEAMEMLAEHSDQVYSCRLNSDYNFTDPDTKEYRYQAVFNIYY